MDPLPAPRFQQGKRANPRKRRRTNSGGDTGEDGEFGTFLYTDINYTVVIIFSILTLVVIYRKITRLCLNMSLN